MGVQPPRLRVKSSIRALCAFASKSPPAILPIMWQTYGHDTAVQTIQRSIAEGRVAHSWLIAGPPRVGKTTLALDLARAVNCVPSGADVPPCGACGQCRRIASGIHPDIRVVGLETARSGRLRTLISIEQVRDVQRELTLLPYEGASRVRHIRVRRTLQRGGRQQPAQDTRRAARSGLDTAARIGLDLCAADHSVALSPVTA